MPRRKAISGVISDTNGSILPLPGPSLEDFDASVKVYHRIVKRSRETVKWSRTVHSARYAVCLDFFLLFFYRIVLPSPLPVKLPTRRGKPLDLN